MREDVREGVMEEVREGVREDVSQRGSEGGIEGRGENFMLQNLGIVLFFYSHNMCQLYSANNFIMLQKYAIMLGKTVKKPTKL